MERNEQAPETAMRELMEETGLTALLGPVIGAYSTWIGAQDSHDGRPGHSFAVIYSASRPSGTLRNTFPANDTTVEAAWFSHDEVNALRRVPIVDFGLAKSAQQTS